MTCPIQQSIAIHCDEKETTCPECGGTDFEECRNKYGEEWLECQECGEIIEE